MRCGSMGLCTEAPWKGAGGGRQVAYAAASAGVQRQALRQRAVIAAAVLCCPASAPPRPALAYLWGAGNWAGWHQRWCARPSLLQPGDQHRLAPTAQVPAHERRRAPGAGGGCVCGLGARQPAAMMCWLGAQYRMTTCGDGYARADRWLAGRTAAAVATHGRASQPRVCARPAHLPGPAEGAGPVLHHLRGPQPAATHPQLCGEGAKQGPACRQRSSHQIKQAMADVCS